MDAVSYTHLPRPTPHPLSFIKRALIVLFFTIPSPFRMRNPEFVKAAFYAIAPRYVATNHVLSMGVDLSLIHIWHENPARQAR